MKKSNPDVTTDIKNGMDPEIALAVWGTEPKQEKHESGCEWWAGYHCTCQ